MLYICEGGRYVHLWDGDWELAGIYLAGVGSHVGRPAILGSNFDFWLDALEDLV